jgi:hypothetical protein
MAAVVVAAAAAVDRHLFMSTWQSTSLHERVRVEIKLRTGVHVRYMSSEVEPCVVWAPRVSLPFLAKLIEG